MVLVVDVDVVLGAVAGVIDDIDDVVLEVVEKLVEVVDVGLTEVVT